MAASQSLRSLTFFIGFLLAQQENIVRREPRRGPHLNHNTLSISPSEKQIHEQQAIYTQEVLSEGAILRIRESLNHSRNVDEVVAEFSAGHPWSMKGIIKREVEELSNTMRRHAHTATPIRAAEAGDRQAVSVLASKATLQKTKTTSATADHIRGGDVVLLKSRSGRYIKAESLSICGMGAPDYCATGRTSGCMIISTRTHSWTLHLLGATNPGDQVRRNSMVAFESHNGTTSDGRKAGYFLGICSETENVQLFEVPVDVTGVEYDFNSNIDVLFTLGFPEGPTEQENFLENDMTISLLAPVKSSYLLSTYEPPQGNSSEAGGDSVAADMFDVKQHADLSQHARWIIQRASHGPSPAPTPNVVYNPTLVR